MWYNEKIHWTGYIVEEFMAKEGLFILNEEDQPATYCGQGEVNIDITMTTENMTRNIRNWQVVEEAMTSDHRIIKWEIEAGKDINNKAIKTFVQKLTKISKKKLKKETRKWESRKKRSTDKHHHDECNKRNKIYGNEKTKQYMVE